MSSPVRAAAPPSAARFRQRILEAPFGLDLLEQRTAVASTRSACSAVDVVALLHGAHAAHARILVGEAPHEVVQQSLAHRAFGHAHPVDAEVLDDFQQDGQTRRKHRRALGVHVRQIEVIDVTRGDHALGEAAQVVERDARRIGIEPAHHVADDAHRAGTAEGLQPAELAVSLLIGSSSSRTAVRARSKRFSEILPSSKKLALKPTQPTDKLSSSNGLKPSPITTSVEPPPMSITSRLSGLMGLVCATPE
jgi:hypothetical protein